MQMYKVFIENKAVIFKINPQLNKKNQLSKKQIWKKIKWITKTQLDGIAFEIKSKDEFKEIFNKYKFIKAAGGLVQRKNKFLFIKRNGVWDIPKGKLEKGEKVKKAAIREIVEECNVNPPKIKAHLLNTYHTYTMNGKKYLKKTYWFWMMANQKDKKLKPQTEEGISKVKYVKVKKFDKIKSKTYKSIVEVINVLESRLDNIN
ncbi:MAG TPA: NUDIX domain-containing protein [Crocinitomix sp.]|nr:NUDIX domain-containing protein [Crocinitomix sp.]